MISLTKVKKMTIKTILKISFVPIWSVFLLFAIQYIFGLISEPNTLHLIYGILLLSVLIFTTLLFIKKLYFTYEQKSN